MTTPIAIWDWEREPHPPNARVGVCRPGFLGDAHTKPTAATCNAHLKALRAGTSFIHTETDWSSEDRLTGRQVIPAIYVERQADLSGVGALLAVQAERRALVLCPREALDLAKPLLCPRCEATDGHWDACTAYYEPKRESVLRDVDIVVIIPPPEARTCEACCGRGKEYEPCACVWALCKSCNSFGRIEPWPMHPSWVRGIVEQCRAAGVPIAFLGWGPWVPTSHLTDASSEAWARLRRAGKREETRVGEDQALFYRVGPEHSGRLLDGEEVVEVPEWLAG